MNDDLQRYLGVAAVIFSFLCGLGACSLGAGLGTYYAGRPPIQLEFRK